MQQPVSPVAAPGTGTGPRFRAGRSPGAPGPRGRRRKPGCAGRPAGTDLSGGQWQRLALARALFAVDAGASVLILDEPTAALDARAEAEFYDRFLEVTRETTTVVISHRFSTVRRADRIVVLDHGRVTETGDHESLLVADGRYAEMFRLQATHFVADDGRGDGGG